MSYGFGRDFQRFGALRVGNVDNRTSRCPDPTTHGHGMAFGIWHLAFWYLGTRYSVRDTRYLVPSMSISTKQSVGTLL